jgi:hypothetical protein
MHMARIDYDRPATISWLNRPFWDDPRGAPLEEHFGDFTLREAVQFAMGQLDIGRCKSVTIKCEGQAFALADIEAMFRTPDFPRT